MALTITVTVQREIPVVSIARQAKTDLEDFLRRGICCRLHAKTPHGDPRLPGCGALDCGTHRAIRALYGNEHQGGCAAEAGVLVNDKAFARRVLGFGGESALVSFVLPVWVQKFATGGEVAVEKLGAGYCYLHAVMPELRMRVARILGPCPLLADVLRVMLVAADVRVRGLRFLMVGPGMFHVALNGAGRQYSCKEYVCELAVEVATGVADARVGVDRPLARDEVEKLRELMARAVAVGVEGASDAAEEVTVVNVKSSGLGVDGLLWARMVLVPQEVVKEVMESERMRELRAFVVEAGVMPNSELMFDLFVASTAVAAMPPSLMVFKKEVAVWAQLGDAVIKMLAASECASKGMDKAYVSFMWSQGSNESMSRALLESGARQVCAMGSIGTSSKGNADVFEAMVGVVARYRPLVEVKMFVCDMGLHKAVVVPGTFDECVERSAVDSSRPVSTGGSSFGDAKDDFRKMRVLSNLGLL